MYSVPINIQFSHLNTFFYGISLQFLVMFLNLIGSTNMCILFINYSESSKIFAIRSKNVQQIY